MLQSTLYKYFRHVLCLAAAATLTTACEQSFDDEAPVAGGKGYITLTLNPSGSQATRDVNYAVDGKYNEDKISTVDLFLYPIGGFNAASTQPIVSQRVALTDADGNKVTVQVPEEQKAALFGSATEGSCYVVAVANCAESEPSKLSTDKSVKALSELVTATDQFKQREKLDSPEENGVNYEPVAPRNFVMVSNLSTEGGNILNTINYVDDAASGTISLKRVAAKIRLAIKLPERLYRHKETKEVFTKIPEGDDESKYALWEPDMGMIRVFFNNGAQKAQLNGELPATMADDWFFNIQTMGVVSDNTDFTYSRKVTEGSNPENAEYPYYHELPLYSYPNKWQDSPSESHRTMLTLVVPWETERTDEMDDEYTTYRPMYYQIPVTTGLNIESNKYYFVCANIRMMGSETPSLPLEVEGTCQISDWGTAETDAKLQVVRYLNVNKTNWEVNNETTVTIPFDSSHKCSIVDADIRGWYYKYRDSGGEAYVGEETPIYFTTSINTSTAGGPLFTWDVDNNKSEINFSHRFFEKWNATTNYNRNSATPNTLTRLQQGTGNSTHYLWSRFVVEMTIRHADDSAFNEKITVTFYPGIYITVEHVTDDSGRKVRGSRNDGYTYVNGYSYSSTSHLNGVYGLLSGTPNLTIITVTQLDEEEKELYEIGDPRTNFINTELSNASMATDVADNQTLWSYGNRNVDNPYDGSYDGGVCKTLWEYPSEEKWWEAIVTPDYGPRTIKYYYPVSETADKAKVIAPQIMIQSNHGYGDGGYSREDARRRCATYQQHGYPAGRWRLPTKAELEFINKLSETYSLIPDLFVGGNYWHNQGHSTNTNTAYLRCVYDLWYWKHVDGEYCRIPLTDPDVKLEDATRAHKENYTVFTWGDRPKENVLN